MGVEEGWERPQRASTRTYFIARGVNDLWLLGGLLFQPLDVLLGQVFKNYNHKRNRGPRATPGQWGVPNGRAQLVHCSMVRSLTLVDVEVLFH